MLHLCECHTGRQHMTTLLLAEHQHVFLKITHRKLHYAVVGYQHKEASWLGRYCASYVKKGAEERS